MEKSKRVNKLRLVLTAIMFSNYCHLSQSTDYCSLTPKHVFCWGTQVYGDACGDKEFIRETRVTQREKESILMVHNRLRSNVARGKLTPQNGRLPLPQASNMRQMYWDEELENAAISSARKCLLKFSCITCLKLERFYARELIYRREAWREEFLNVSWGYIIRKMFNDDLNSFEASYIENLRNLKRPNGFAQVVAADVYLVGCAKIHYQESNRLFLLAVCTYAPADSESQFLYQKGAPCNDCPIFTQCSKEFDGICGKRFSKSETERKTNKTIPSTSQLSDGDLQSTQITLKPDSVNGNFYTNNTRLDVDITVIYTSDEMVSTAIPPSSDLLQNGNDSFISEINHGESSKAEPEMTPSKDIGNKISPTKAPPVIGIHEHANDTKGEVTTASENERIPGQSFQQRTTNNQRYLTTTNNFLNFFIYNDINTPEIYKIGDDILLQRPPEPRGIPKQEAKDLLLKPSIDEYYVSTHSSPPPKRNFNSNYNRNPEEHYFYKLGSKMSVGNAEESIPLVFSVDPSLLQYENSLDSLLNQTYEQNFITEDERNNGNKIFISTSIYFLLISYIL